MKVLNSKIAFNCTKQFLQHPIFVQPFNKNIIAMLKGLGNKSGKLEFSPVLFLLAAKKRVPMLAQL